MTKILIIVPYHDVYKNVQDEITHYDTSGLQIDLTHLYGTANETFKNIDADIVVARGITYMAIAQLKPHIHVVPILQGPNDLIEAFHEASHRTTGKIGILSGSEDLCDTGHVSNLIGRTVEMYVANDQDEIVRGVEFLKDSGCDIFLGGLTMCRYCEQQAYPYVHIKSGMQSIRRAIMEAITTARSLERAKVRMNILNTLINNDKDAMVALNSRGIVVVANHMAERLLGTGLVNQPLRAFYGGKLWEKTLESGGDNEVIEVINGQQILVSSIPIMTGTEGLGVLLTFQNIDTIRSMERRIRTELSKKGLVARYTFSDIITQDPAFLQLIEKGRRYAKVDGAVLLIGETGTGKELFAQSIHNASKRRGEPFVAINCAALPESLLESELFGYSEGAFSGAAKGGKQGLFELAHKGTIFLDEIGEMPLNLQAKLLRVLQEKEVRRVGGDTVVPVDVRVISATNVNINQKVKRGEFRLDLFYRISLLNLRLISLSERLDDIPVLFLHFVTTYCATRHVDPPAILEEAYEVLKAYPWPGNVRELRNAAERLVILLSSDTIGKDQIRELDIAATSFDDDEADSLTRRKVSKQKIVPEGEELLRRFKESGMTQQAFARSIGVSRTTLWRKLSAHIS